MITTKSKLQYSNFCEKKGISTVIILNPKTQKKYMGKAKMHPEDKEYKSSYFGCLLAELRATRKMLKDELNQLKFTKKYILQSGGLRKEKATQKLEMQIKTLEEKINTIYSEKNIKIIAKDRIKSLKDFYKINSEKEKRHQKLENLRTKILNFIENKEVNTKGE